MVFFNCNACGESLKKNQVEKHYQFKCRNCEVLSCVDCGKDFWGDKYQEHTKCISEEEKYSGKNYQPKANANKGEAKQEQWTQFVQEAIRNAPANNPKLKNLLEKLEDYPNIPRKKAKFENFLKNSLRIWDAKLAAQVWDTLGLDKVKLQTQQSDQQQSNKNGTELESPAEDHSKPEDSETKSDDHVTEKKLSKRERKEERRKQKNKVEKKDKRSVESEESHKTAKKRKHQELEVDNDQTGGSENTRVSKKKKKKHKELPEVEENNTVDDEADEETECVKKDVTKFDWESVMVEVLQKADCKEVSVKKLRKKVLAEYSSQMADAYQLPAEKLYSKFNKKLKNRRFRVLKERVKLLE